VIFPDVNILLYAHDVQSRFHREAADWLETTIGNEQVFFSWQTITGFLRIITNPRSSSNPLPLKLAIEIVDSWLANDNCHIVPFEKKHWPLFAATLIEGRAVGNLVMDAHVAAMAISVGAKVASLDRDLLRFSNIQFIDPILS
jgi:toxin-antitoxin system PIN domain toxin